MSANPQRGEIEITLADKTYTLRASFGAVAKIEGRLNRSVFELMRRVLSIDIQLREAAVVIEECIVDGGGDPPANIGEVIRASGLTKLTEPLIKLLTNAVRGDAPEEKKGEAKPVAP